MSRTNSLGAAIFATLSLLPVLQAHGQGAYPSRPITIVVPFTPGGTPDSTARLAALHLQARLGQPVVVENKPGAGGNIGAAMVASSAPDGYTLLLAQSGLTWASFLDTKLSFDPLAFAPVAILAYVPFMVTVHKDVPVNSIRDLVAYARANPGKLSCATSGIGSPQHLLAELFMNRTGTRVELVPYKGTAGIMPDFVQGRIQLLFSASDGVLPHIQAGRLRALATIEKKRLVALPQVETVAESGLEFDASIWVGLYAPPGTPDALARRLADELRSIDPASGDALRLANAGTVLRPGTPAELGAQMKSDFEKWGSLIKSAKIKMN